MTSPRSSPPDAWRLALEHAGFGVWDLDPVHETVHYSPEWKRRLALPNPDAADPTSFWRSRVHQEDLEPMMDALRAHLDGRRDTYEMRFRLRDGGGAHRWVLSRGRVVARDVHGAALRVVGTMVELPGSPLSALCPPVATLSQLNHELRTPLHAILGFAQLLQGPGGEGLSAQQRERIALIQSAGWQLLSVVEDLLQQAVRDAAERPAKG